MSFVDYELKNPRPEQIVNKIKSLGVLNGTVILRLVDVPKDNKSIIIDKIEDYCSCNEYMCNFDIDNDDNDILDIQLRLDVNHKIRHRIEQYNKIKRLIKNMKKHNQNLDKCDNKIDVIRNTHFFYMNFNELKHIDEEIIGQYEDELGDVCADFLKLIVFGKIENDK